VNERERERDTTTTAAAAAASNALMNFYQIAFKPIAERLSFACLFGWKERKKEKLHRRIIIQSNINIVSVTENWIISI